MVDKLHDTVVNSISDYNDTVRGLTMEIDTLKEEVLNLKKSQNVVKTNTYAEVVKSRLQNYGQIPSDRFIIVLDGVAERDIEDVYEIIVLLASSLKVKLERRDISAAKRIGKPRNHGNRPRPILACFLHVSLRDELMNKKSQLKTCSGFESVWLNPYEPKEVRISKGKVRNAARTARKLNATVKLTHDSVTIDGAQHKVGEVEQIPAKYTTSLPNPTSPTQNNPQVGTRPKITSIRIRITF